jgi:hypothetical protein
VCINSSICGDAVKLTDSIDLKSFGLSAVIMALLAGVWTVQIVLTL